MNAFDDALAAVQWEQWRETAGRFFDRYIEPGSPVPGARTASWRPLFVELLVRCAETEAPKPTGWEQDDELAVRLFCDYAFAPVTAWMMEQEGRDWDGL